MLTLRRFLVLGALLFWQGGFTFYAAVVVPVGRSVLAKELDKQGRITGRVTNYLNLAGGVALGLLLPDLLSDGDPAKRRRWGRWLLWLAMLLALGALLWFHVLLDRMFPAPEPGEHPGFRPLHRLYLWVSTGQWACAVLYLLLTLRAWHAEDAVPAASLDVREGPSTFSALASSEPLPSREPIR
jgi:hypothetical protein